MQNDESVLVFCSSKAETERVASAIADRITRNRFLLEKINMKRVEVGMFNELQHVDDVLRKTAAVNVAFHHAGQLFL